MHLAETGTICVPIVSTLMRVDKRTFWFCRRHLPTIAATSVAVLYLAFQEMIVLKIACEEVSLSGLYRAIFGWAAIQTGFLFGIYTYISGKSGGFVGAVSRTATFQEFKSYILTTLRMALVVSLVSVPFIVLIPEPAKPWDFSSIVLCAWLCFCIFAFCCFCKVLRVFTSIDRANAHD